MRAAVTKLDLGKWHNVPWKQAELVLMMEHYKKGIDGIKPLLPDRTQGPLLPRPEKWD